MNINFNVENCTFDIWVSPKRSKSGCSSPVVACWASDHWVANSNPLRGIINFTSLSPVLSWPRFSLINVHKGGLELHHFISFPKRSKTDQEQRSHYTVCCSGNEFTLPFLQVHCNTGGSSGIHHSVRETPSKMRWGNSIKWEENIKYFKIIFFQYLKNS